MSEFKYHVLAYTDYGEGHIINGVIDSEDLAAAIFAAGKDAQAQIDEHLRVINVVSLEEVDASAPAIIDGFIFNDVGEFENGKTER